eukprot:Amastigsp_a842540_113.p1 type:complete len:850 gc:universal Amastigsp_a842540_113:29-2578(+)
MAASSAANNSNASFRSEISFTKDTISEKDLTVGDIFDELRYGPAPEEANGLTAWLDEHNRRFGHFINNEWVIPSGAKFKPSTCPATGEVLAETVEGSDADVVAAVAAAKAAQVSWAALSPHVRAKHLYAIARHVQKHHRLLAVLESMDNGKPIREARDLDVPLLARHFYHHAGWAALMAEELKEWEPVGVVAGIIPWNFPLMILGWKVAPALAMGNTVVIKPASNTRLSALLFAEICAEAGVPAGVINVVTASGRAGSVLADHPDVDKVAFTGSTPIGRDLRRRLAGSGKKISLELGGKSPFIVFDSADLDSAVEGVIDAIYTNGGQVCCAGSRLLLQENVWEPFLAKLRRRMNTLRLGHPLDKCIDMGPLVDQSQFDSVSAYVEQARSEGAVVFHANIHVPEVGSFYPPTLITNVAPVSACVHEEIFGPVLVALPFRDPEEAIKLANNSNFGLAASLWTENTALAAELSLKLKAGTVWVNRHNAFDAASGFGGFRESGFGRDGGREGLFEYCKPKAIPKVRPGLSFPVEEKDIQWPYPAPSRPAQIPSSTTGAVDRSILGVDRVDRTQKIFVNGKQCRPDQGYSKPIYNPDGGLISEVADSNRKDVRDAVESAWKAHPGWAKRSAHNRAQICYFIAENLMRRSEEFTQRIQVQTGRSTESCEEEVRKSVERLFFYAAYADKYGGIVQETTLYGVTMSINESRGVVGVACDNEFPLLGFVSLIAPLLVRGNCIIVVPSEDHPLCATDLYQVFETSDVPAGVINILTGFRDKITKHLVEHYQVEAMWYFGSAEGSRNVEYVSALNMKRTWVNFGYSRNWLDDAQGQGQEFLVQATESKAVWIPFGEMRFS